MLPALLVLPTSGALDAPDSPSRWSLLCLFHLLTLPWPHLFPLVVLRWSHPAPWFKISSCAEGAHLSPAWGFLLLFSLINFMAYLTSQGEQIYNCTCPELSPPTPDPHCLQPSLPQVMTLPCFSLCCHSVVKLCPTPCDPLDCSIPGFPSLHYLLEFA